MNVGIYVYDNVEVLDFAGPYEVFTTATRMQQRAEPDAQPLFSVFTIGSASTPVRARAGLKIEPDYSLHDHPPLDCLVLAGGVVDAELDKAEVTHWIARQCAVVPMVASVCTGAFLLARSGRLDGLSATTHWEDLDDFRRQFPAVGVREARWVDEGQVVTSAGISAGIDMSLHLVERLHSRALALRTARQLDFDWSEA